ncbi:hypothetical protein QTO34_012515 [Cnephaeus nilssonii]|uniref:Fibronectin type-III domain-containing protein n=1 Tax=Cnephaeus nilssonii TaxID=3371016 RepID=A0AA40HC07_CNENI|nr:hypothetical protein QTO34_012515 [Eptesicus nilssonii]
MAQALSSRCHWRPPDGVLPPRLAAPLHQSSGCLVYTSSEQRPGSARYQLQMRPGRSSPALLELFSSPSASLSHEVRDLQPHTEYAFRVVASNGFGSALSPWVLFMTTEDSKCSACYTAKCPLHGGVFNVFSFS